MASQLPLPALLMALGILSMSLSQDMHLSCFLVSRASFSFYSSSDITRMISFILDSRNSRAFFTSNLSLLRNMSSFICRTRSSMLMQYFSQSGVLTLFQTLLLMSFRVEYISVWNILSLSSSFPTLFSFWASTRLLSVLVLSSSFLSLKAILSSRVSHLAQIFISSGFISFILSIICIYTSLSFDFCLLDFSFSTEFSIAFSLFSSPSIFSLIFETANFSTLCLLTFDSSSSYCELSLRFLSRSTGWNPLLLLTGSSEQLSAELTPMRPAGVLMPRLFCSTFMSFLIFSSTSFMIQSSLLAWFLSTFWKVISIFQNL